VQKLFVWAHI